MRPTFILPRRPGRSDERGMALALALFALVILGALVSLSVAMSRFDRAGAAGAGYGTQAQNAAEAGLAAMAATWDPTIHSVMPVWDGTPATEWSTGLRSLGGDPLVQYVDSVRRINTALFVVRSFGQRLDRSGNVLAQLELDQILRLTKPTISVNAAITVQDPLQLNGNAFAITGINGLPDQWSPSECDPLDPSGVDDVVGVRSSTSTGVQSQDYDNVFGFPARDAPNDPSITSATFQNFLDYTFNTLAAQPGVKVLPLSSTYNGVAPVVDGTGACDRAQLLNFGEPWRDPPTAGAVAACEGYFPVVHGTGSVTSFAAGNRGQGTLLVDGDLKLTGGFEWAGLIIVRGELQISGTGNKVSGAILAEGASVTSSGAVSGDVDITYSACAIEKAIGGATLAQPLHQRSWAQVY